MAEGLRILAVCFVDVVVGVLLFVLACIVGGAIHYALTPDVEILYIAWFMLASLPFFLYAKWRQVINFDWWDVIVYGPTIFILSWLTLSGPLFLDFISAALKMSIMIFVTFGWEGFRETKFPRRNQPSETSGHP